MKFYIARDRDNRLYLYREKPFKGDLIFICQCYNTKPKHWSEYFEMYEEAALAGVKYTLDNLI